MSSERDARFLPVEGPAVWTGPAVAWTADWRHRLSATEVAELDAALARARATGKAMDLRRRPELVPLLYEPWYWDRHEEQGPGEDPYFALPICSHVGGRLRFFYIGWYIRNAQRHAAVPRLTPAQHELLDLIDAIADDPALRLEFTLEPGEIAYLKNSTALHARTAYEDEDAPERKRYMVRLWLTAHDAWADGDAFVRQGIPRKHGVASDAEAIAAADAGHRHEKENRP